MEKLCFNLLIFYKIYIRQQTITSYFDKKKKKKIVYIKPTPLKFDLLFIML